MLTRLRAHLTYANVVSSLCLFIVLGGGTAYAAKTIGSKDIANNSVQGKDIKNGTITGSDVKKQSLTADRFRAGQLPRGATGPQGPAGAAGRDGAPATKLFASVNAEGGLNFGSGVTTTSGSAGAYTVTFNRNLNGCAAIATAGFGDPSMGSNISGAALVVARASVGTDYVSVNVSNINSNSLAAGSFFIAVFC